MARRLSKNETQSRTRRRRNRNKTRVQYRGSREDLNIKIVEIQSMSSPEYIDLYNMGDVPVSLEGWVILDTNDEARKFINFEICPSINTANWIGDGCVNTCTLQPGQTLTIWESGYNAQGTIFDMEHTSDCWIAPNNSSGMWTRGFNGEDEPANQQTGTHGECSDFFNEEYHDCAHLDKDRFNIGLFSCDPTGGNESDPASFQWDNQINHDCYVDHSGILQQTDSNQTLQKECPEDVNWITAIQSPGQYIPSGPECINIIDPDPGSYGQLFINEFSSRDMSFSGLNDSSDFVELYNPNTFDISLHNWQITDSGDYQFMSIPEGPVVPANGFLLVMFNDCTDGNDINGNNIPVGCGNTTQCVEDIGPPCFDGQYLHVPTKLNGGNDEIRIFNPNGDLVDSFSWTGGHLTDSDNCTYNTITDGGLWGEQRCEGTPIYPTPGSSNNIEESQPYDFGDVTMDGVINVVDIIIVVNHILYDYQLNDFQQFLADVDQNGQINIADIVLIVQQIIDITPEQQSAIIRDARKLISNRNVIY